MVRNHVVVIGEFLATERALAVLKGDLLVHQLSHLCVRSEFPVAARMMGILDPANTHLPWSSLPGRHFPATAEPGTMDRAKLVASESHGFPPCGEIVRVCCPFRIGMQSGSLRLVTDSFCGSGREMRESLAAGSEAAVGPPIPRNRLPEQ